MALPDRSPAWHKPLQDLHHARVLFRKLRADMLALQKREYDDQILAYLTGIKDTGLPFSDNFSGEPDAIQHIKNLTNALYLAEQAFEKLGDLNLTTLNTYNQELIKKGYDACHLVLDLMTDVESNFRHEIAYIASSLSSLLNITNTSNATNNHVSSHDIGATFGRVIQRMAPTSDQNDFDLLSYFGATFPAYPTYIAALRVNIEKQTSRNPEHTPNIHKEKMEQLLEQGTKLCNTIANSNKNVLYFVFNLLSLINQILALFTEIAHEAGDLNDTLQSLGREQLALLKYELLPALFKGVDKLEAQLMLKPGRLSKPLMQHIKPWYEALVQRAKLLIPFDETNQQLLKLEDAPFIALRLAPMQKEIETSKQVLHLVDPALTALDQYLLALPNLKRFTKNDEHTRLQESVKNQFACMKPYMSARDKAFIQQVDKHLSPEANLSDYFIYDTVSDWYSYWTRGTKARNNPSLENVTYVLTQLRQRWEQLKTNHTFELQRHEEHIQSIQQQANRVVFPYNTSRNITHISEEEVLDNAYLMSDNIQLIQQGDDIYVQNPKNINTNASWALYRSYEQQLAKLKEAERDCDHLLDALDNHQPWLATQTLGFNPKDRGYTLDLLKNGAHQLEKLYVSIEDEILKYEVLEPPKKPYHLYLMTLEEAIDAGHRGYIWNHDQRQLSYIADNGQIHADVNLTNSSYLKVLMKRKKAQNPKNNEFPLTKEAIYGCITSQGGHHPYPIRKGSIPRSELGCSLTQLTNIEQLTPYLSHIFNEALERGHIQDQFKTTCIAWYSSIQPYLVGAFKNDNNMRVEAFDERITHLFSGRFYKNTSEPVPVLSLTETNNKLIALKLELKTQITKQENRRDIHFQQLKNQTFVIQPEPDNKLKHPEFSIDTAQFMHSLDPIKRQIHKAKNTLFKINLALNRLTQYKPEARLNKEDYPWFQAYVGQFSNTTTSQIRTQLEQIQAYEKQQIKLNQRILKTIKNKTTTITSNQTNDMLGENKAFMYFGHAYEPSLMPNNTPPQLGELQLEIVGEELHYKFLHYGQVLDGTIPLHQIEPTLTEFNNNTIISNNTLSSILAIAYRQREHQIGLDPTVLSPDEALDLYQWYVAKYNELSDIKSEHAGQLNQKIALYKTHAEKKPTAKITQQNTALADRSRYLVKHKRISTYMTDIKKSFRKNFEHLNDALKKELHVDPKSPHLPYPEVSAQNWLIDVLKELFNLHPIEAIQALPVFKKTPTSDLDILENPRQVLLLKRLMNVLYYLEHIALEIEQIHEQDLEIPYMMHLVISYFYAQDINPLMQELSNDPLFSKVYADLATKIDAVSKLLNQESKYYLETNKPDEKQTNKNTVLLSILNTLKMLPVRLSSSTPDFERKYQSLKKSTQKSAKSIEKILEHYNSSWSYLLLLMDLPSIQYLLSDMRRDFEDILKHTHDLTTQNLDKIKTTYLDKILLEADALENTLSLAPGLISNPLKEIFDEFYKGLITPLVPDMNREIEVRCDNTLIERRLEATHVRKKSEAQRLVQHKKASEAIKDLLDACSKAEEVCTLRCMADINPRTLSSDNISALLNHNIGYLRYGANVFFFDEAKQLHALSDEESRMFFPLFPELNTRELSPTEILSRTGINPQQAAYEELNTVYQATLPTVKAALNSSDLHLMSFQEAKQQELRDCFVWDEQISQLYHLDREGKPNPQTGCKLFLKSIPAGEDKPEHLEHETNMSHPDGGNKKIGIQRTTLVLHGDKYYIYANADGSGWKYTKLDSEIIASMGLDFSHTKPLDIHKKYLEIYEEIASKTGLVYNIHLKNTYKALSFIARKKEPGSNKIYLSEHAISEYITSNSDFSLPQHGIRIEPGCCLASMDTIPTDFYELKLPAGYSSYYVQIKNNTDVLYFIDTETRSIKKLPIPDDKQADAIRVLKHTKKNQIFDTHNFDEIKLITDHTCDASIMIDINRFKPDVQSFEKLQTLATRCKAYYKGMEATSKLTLKTANEQLAFLTQAKATQKEQHIEIKKEVYTKYLKQKIDVLAQENITLQGYKLCLLTDKTRLKPNCLYIKIRDGAIDYRVINPAGKERKSSVNLQQIDWPEDKPLTSINELIPYLPAMLRITSKKGDGHTRSYTLANEYQQKLTENLLSNSDPMIRGAITSRNATKHIDKVLGMKRAGFKNKHLKHYQQLDTIHQAVGDFHLYLKASEVQQSKHGLSFFEKEGTIRTKREILRTIDLYISNPDKPAKERIQEIQTYLKPLVLNDLMSHHTYESICFESLLQCVFNLLEAAGLYTPKMIQRLDKLIKVVEKNNADVNIDTSAPKKTNDFRFFKETTREKIKSKISQPKPDDSAPNV